MLQRNSYNKICRTCLSENYNMKPIFKNDEFVEPITLHDILITCASIRIQKGDGLPEQLCPNCIQDMKKAYSFRKLCEASDEKLRNYLSSFLAEKVQSDILKDDCKSYSASQIFHKRDSLFEHNTDSSFFNDSDVENNEDKYIQDTCKNKTVNLQETYCCTLCNEIYVELEAYKEHTMFHENFVSHSSRKNKSEFTSECHKSSEKVVDQPLYSGKEPAKNKTRIIRKHNQPRTCQICNKTFRFHSILECHKLIHSGEKPFLCNICGKGFAQLSYLKIHSFIHSGEKPYKCKTCQKSFAAPGTLVTHIRTHTGERPHICNICGKTFPQSGYLSSHIRTHTGEKLAECKVCNKRFNQRGRLKIHMRIHSGERPYPCNECGRNFAVKGTLKKHIRTHTGERPYICSICGQAFAQNGTLSTHMKIHKTK